MLYPECRGYVVLYPLVVVRRRRALPRVSGALPTVDGHVLRESDGGIMVAGPTTMLVTTVS